LLGENEKKTTRTVPKPERVRSRRREERFQTNPGEIHKTCSRTRSQSYSFIFEAHNQRGKLQKGSRREKKGNQRGGGGRKEFERPKPDHKTRDLKVHSRPPGRWGPSTIKNNTKGKEGKEKIGRTKEKKRKAKPWECSKNHP